MSARSALLLVIVVLLAGCGTQVTPSAETTQPTVREPSSDRQSPTTPDQSPNEAADNASTIPVTGGRLAADPNQMFRYVNQRLGVDVRPPERIRIVNPEEMQSSSHIPPFLQVLGVKPMASNTGLSAQTIGADLVRVNRSIATQPRIEGLLAHEFVHVVHTRRGTVGRMFHTGGWDTVPAFGVERPLVIESVTEGIATYIADRYQRTHTETLPQGTRYRRMYQQRDSAGGRYFMAPYWFGYRYVTDRLRGNETVESIYEQPPKTTEAIIHRYEPGEEPPANLSVTVSAEQWQPDKRGRIGELGIRIALSAKLNTSRAVVGADGWGNDLLIPFERGSERGYIWVTRWDDPTNETEFEDTLTATFDMRATKTGSGWREGETAFRVRGSDDNTTVVIAGPQEFVRNASVEIGDQVTVAGP